MYQLWEEWTNYSITGALSFYWGQSGSDTLQNMCTELINYVIKEDMIVRTKSLQRISSSLLEKFLPYIILFSFSGFAFIIYGKTCIFLMMRLFVWELSTHSFVRLDLTMTAMMDHTHMHLA